MLIFKYVLQGGDIMKKAEEILKFSGIGIVVFGLITNAETINKEIIYSLKMWATILIPSLFPYLVISRYTIQKGFPSFFSPMKKLISKFFNISYSSSEVFLCSLLCGYPCGGICASDIYQKGEINKNEAQRLICFTNGASPVFLICAVGGVMLGKTDLGILMYFVQTTSSVIIGFILGMFSPKFHSGKSGNQKFAQSASITECCEKSVVTITNIAGYMIAATAAGEIIICMLSPLFNFPGLLKNVVYYFLEISKAMKLLSDIKISGVSFALMCACASFGGVSVIMQIFGVIDKNLKSFRIVVSRLVGAGISFILGLVLYRFHDMDITNINPDIPIIISLMLTIVIFVSFVIHKNRPFNTKCE